MEKNLITEIRRISELIGVNNNTILNEGGILGNLFKNFVESELIAILKTEIKAAMKQGVEVVSKNGVLTKSVKDAAEAAVKTKTGFATLSNTQKRGIESELTRLAKEEAETIVRKKGSTATLNAAEKEAYEKLAAAEKSRLGAKSLGQGTREKLIRKVTISGKNVTLKSTKVPRGITNKIKQATREAAIIAVTQKWNWPRWVKWAAIGGLSVLAVWWLIVNLGVVPDDIPKTDENLTDDGNGQDGGTGGGGLTGKFTNCTGTYKQNCKSEVIRKVQGCLDIKPDSLFGPKTQAALESKGFKDGFTDADVDKLCPPNVVVQPVVEPPISKEDQYGYDTGNKQETKPQFDSTVSNISVDKLDSI